MTKDEATRAAEEAVVEAITNVSMDLCGAVPTPLAEHFQDVIDDGRLDDDTLCELVWEAMRRQGNTKPLTYPEIVHVLRRFPDDARRDIELLLGVSPTNSPPSSSPTGAGLFQ